MGNDLIVQRFKAGECAADDPLFEEIFAPFVIVEREGFRRLDFGDGQSELYGTMFAHFHSEMRMFDLLVDFLKRSRGSVAYWHDEAPCGAVGQASDLAELHPELVRIVDPKVVSSGKDLGDLICGVGEHFPDPA